MNVSLLNERVVKQCETPTSLTISKDGKSILTGTQHGKIIVWNTANRVKKGEIRGMDDKVYAIQFSPNGSILAVGGNSKFVRLLETKTFNTVNVFTGPFSSSITTIAFNHQETEIGFGKLNGAIEQWSLIFNEKQFTPYCHTEQVTSISYNPVKLNQCASGSKDTTVIISDLTKDKRITTLIESKMPITTVLFSPDGNHLMTASMDGTIRAYETVLFIPTAHMTHSNGVTCMVFNLDGSHLISGGEDHLIKVWDAFTFTLIRTLTNHTDAIIHLAYSPTGEYFISNGKDNKMIFHMIKDF
jgi:WD40 repeat protein